MAHVGAYASTPTEQLYDRREDCVTLDEALKISIRSYTTRDGKRDLSDTT